MNTDLSLLNPGTSIQFDAHAMLLQEEREHQEEEDENREELLQLLNDASFEDLLDDEEDTLGGSIHDASYHPINVPANANSHTPINAPDDTSAIMYRKAQPFPIAPAPHPLNQAQVDNRLDASIYDAPVMVADGYSAVQGTPVYNHHTDQVYPEDSNLQHQSETWLANGSNVHSLSDYTYNQTAPYPGTDQPNDDGGDWTRGDQTQWYTPLKRSDERFHLYDGDFNNQRSESPTQDDIIADIPLNYNTQNQNCNYNAENPNFIDAQYMSEKIRADGSIPNGVEPNCTDNLNYQKNKNSGDVYSNNGPNFFDRRPVHVADGDAFGGEQNPALHPDQPIGRYTDGNLYGDFTTSRDVYSSSDPATVAGAVFSERSSPVKGYATQNQASDNFNNGHVLPVYSDESNADLRRVPGVNQPQFGIHNDTRRYLNQRESRTDVHDPAAREFPEQYQVVFTGRSDHCEAPGSATPLSSDGCSSPSNAVDQTNDDRRFEQLQVLYNARSRQMDEMRRELEGVKADSARDIRILKHKLSLAEGEKEGCLASLKQCQALLAESKERLADCEGQLMASNAQIQALRLAKESANTQLHAAESAINNLTEQLSTLTNSDSLERARSQHDSVVAGIRAKYDSEILGLKTALDDVKATLSSKEDDLDKVKTELARVRTESHSESAGTIARLAHQVASLSQQASSQEDVGVLRYQLQQAQSSATFSREMCSSLQEEVSELKEQLTLYESASRLRASSLPSASSSGVPPGDVNDSMTDLGIKRTLTFDTPDVTNSSGVDRPGDMVPLLRGELEKCMGVMGQKRAQVVTLQEETRALRTQVDTLTTRCERAEKSCTETQAKLCAYETMCGNSTENVSTATEKRLKKDADNLKQENDLLRDELQEVSKRLDEVSSNETRLNEINRDLNQRIADMISEFDEDKRLALNKCQEAWTQLNEDSKRRIREEVISECGRERDAIVREHRHLMDQLRCEVDSSQQELDTIKTLYVRVCEEKDGLREEIQREYDCGMDQEKAAMEARLAQEYEEKLSARIEHFKETSFIGTNDDREKDMEVVEKRSMGVAGCHESCSVGSSLVADDVELRAVDGGSNGFLSKADFNNRLEMEITIAKSAWFDEQKKGRQSAIDAALLLAEQTWRAQQNEEWDAKWEQAKRDLVETKNAEFETLLKVAKESWRKENCRTDGETASDKVNKLKSSEMQTDVAGRCGCDIVSMGVGVDGTREAVPASVPATSRLTACDDTTTVELLRGLVDERDMWFKALESAQLLPSNFCYADVLTMVDKFSKLTQRICELEEEIGLLKRDSDGKRRDICDFETERDNYSEEKTREEASVMQSELEAARSVVKQKQLRIDNLIADLDEVRVLLESKTGDYERVKNDLGESTKQFGVAMETVVDLEKRFGDLKVEYDRIVSVHEECGVKNSAELSGRKAEMEDVKKQLEKVKVELSFSKELSQRFKSELQIRGSELENLRVQLAACEEKFRVQDSEMEKMESELEKGADEMKERERDLKREKERLVVAQGQVDAANVTIEELKSEVLELKTRCESLAKQLVECQENLNQRVEEERDSLMSGFAEKEKCFHEEIDNLVATNSELKTEVEKYDRRMKAIGERYRQQTTNLRESLQAEHDVAMGTMKKKMVELRRAHIHDVEEQRRRFHEEKVSLEAKINELTSRSSLISTPTQTDTGDVEKAAILDLRSQYINTANLIKEDVNKHVTETNKRAVDAIRAGVKKERKTFAVELRDKCLTLVQEFLQHDLSLSGNDLKLVLSKLKQHLDVIIRALLSSKGTYNPTRIPTIPLTDIHGAVYFGESNISVSTPRSTASSSSSDSKSAVSSRVKSPNVELTQAMIATPSAASDNRDNAGREQTVKSIVSKTESYRQRYLNTAPPRSSSEANLVEVRRSRDVPKTAYRHANPKVFSDTKSSGYVSVADNRHPGSCATTPLVSSKDTKQYRLSQECNITRRDTRLPGGPSDCPASAKTSHDSVIDLDDTLVAKDRSDVFSLKENLDTDNFGPPRLDGSYPETSQKAAESNFVTMQRDESTAYNGSYRRRTGQDGGFVEDLLDSSSVSGCFQVLPCDEKTSECDNISLLSIERDAAEDGVMDGDDTMLKIVNEDAIPYCSQTQTEPKTTPSSAASCNVRKSRGQNSVTSLLSRSGHRDRLRLSPNGAEGHLGHSSERGDGDGSTPSSLMHVFKSGVAATFSSPLCGQNYAGRRVMGETPNFRKTALYDAISELETGTLPDSTDFTSTFGAQRSPRKFNPKPERLARDVKPIRDDDLTFTRLSSECGGETITNGAESTILSATVNRDALYRTRFTDVGEKLPRAASTPIVRSNTYASRYQLKEGSRDEITERHQLRLSSTPAKNLGHVNE